MPNFGSCQSNRTHTDGLHNEEASRVVQDLLRHLTSAYMKRVYGWAGVRYVITKFSQMDSLPNFLTHGVPLCARFARARSSAKTLRMYFSPDETGEIQLALGSSKALLSCQTCRHCCHHTETR